MKSAVCKVENTATNSMKDGAKKQERKMAIAKEHEIVRKELEESIRTAADSSLVGFFGGKVPDYARKYLAGELCLGILLEGTRHARRLDCEAAGE